VKPVDWVILGIVLLAVAAAALFRVRSKKRGGCGCGCADCSARGLCKKSDETAQKKADKSQKA
jgi:hypothetical protein